jgi:iron complex outermembrane receptor protein
MGKRSYWLCAACLWVLIGPAGPCFAEKETNAVVLDAVVVTAKGSKDALLTGDVDTEETSASVVVIEREQFEGKIEGVAEVIKKEAGIQVRQSGGLGSYSSVSLRGSTSDQVMVFLDGILLNSGSGGGVDLSTISLSDVASIELYKGASPLNFGKASIGGVVNIKTIRSGQGVNANAGVGYGSFNAQRASGFVNHKPGRFDYLLSAETLSSDNDYEIVNNNGTQYYPDDDTVEPIHNGDFSQFNLLGKAGYDLSDKSRVVLLHQYFTKDQGLPHWDNLEDAKTRFNVDRNISTLKYTYNGIMGLPLNLASKLDYTRHEEEYNDPEGHVGLGVQQKTRYFTTRYGGDLYLEWLAEYQTIAWTVDVHSETYDIDDIATDDDTDTSRRLSFSTGLQDTVSLFDDTLRLSPAIRYSRIRDKLNSLMDSFAVTEEELARTSDYWSPQIGIVYQPLAWLKAKANLGRYFREPSFYELSGDRGFVIGNPELKAEQGTNFDIGVEINGHTRHPWLNRFSVSGTYFNNTSDELIAIAYDGRGVGKAVNIPGAHITGLELGTSLEGFTILRLSANATIQETENRDDEAAFEGKELPGKWGRSYGVKLEARYRGIKAHTEYFLGRDLYYDTPNLLKAKDKKELNAGISLLWNYLLFSFEVKNIQDNEYEDFRGYPLPGRYFFGSVTYKH